MLATKTDGTLWSWGYNAQGQLGTNTAGGPTKVSSPVQIPGTSWAEPECGSMSCYATRTDGTLWAWGKNTEGHLGQNSEVSYSSPVQVGSESDWDKTVGAGWYSALQQDESP